jgi:hypothetical protein
MACPWRAAKSSLPIFTKLLQSVRFEQSLHGAPALAPKLGTAAPRPADPIELPFVPMPP